MQALPTPVVTACCEAGEKLLWHLCCILLLLAAVFATPVPKNGSPDATPIFKVRVEAPVADVLAAVQQVAQDQIIHGTYSYEKERILYGAHSADAASVFGPWRGDGTAVYKVAGNILSPRYFKDTNDIGTVSIRYVVQTADASATILQIDAMFVDARRGKHPSLGNVEASEYSAIQQHLRTIQGKRQAMEEKSAPGSSLAAVQPPPPMGASAEANAPSELSQSVPAMQKHVDALRHEVELRVRDQGAQVKASPFHSSATLQSLPAQAEVLIVVVTPYWYGVETEDGHRGWVHHSQLEPLP